MAAYFLIKSEPFVYAWSQLVKDGKTAWTGVRNFEARNRLRAMKKGDLALYYHSNEGKEIVGIARVVREAYPDPTADEGDWSAVDFAPEKALANPVGLGTLKSTAALANLEMLKRSRLSVTTLTAAEWKKILSLAK
jgi:predicted RNA-binding protein with PUA-like domain